MLREGNQMKIALNIIHDRPVEVVNAWWRDADEAGVDVIAVVDSPAILRELYVSSTLCVRETNRTIVMTGVTNPVSRDPSVTASALFALHELAPGRVALGIGIGDSALWGVGLKPARLAHLREYILSVKSLLAGEVATYQGRQFRSRWSPASAPLQIPIYVPVAGPKTLRMAAEVADGMILSMGFGDDNVTYVRKLLDGACKDVSRSVADLDLWWNSEVVFGDSREEARSRQLGISTSWLTMGSLEGKQIPDHLRDALVRFNQDIHDLGNSYQDRDRDQILLDRARQYGLYDWLISRAPGLWGTPTDIADRLLELGKKGMDNWMFYVGRGKLDRGEHIRLIAHEVLPRVKSASSSGS